MVTEGVTKPKQWEIVKKELFVHVGGMILWMQPTKRKSEENWE